MSDANSYAEFILGVYRAQLVDCARWYPGLSKEFKRDLLRLGSAVKSHGIRFTLDVMPSFRKHFDKCLSEGRLTPSHFTHFGVDEKGGTIPRLFRGLVLRVFDRSGLLKNQPDVDAIRWIRQLLGVVRKLRLTASDKDGGEAVRDFYRTDMAVRRGHLNWDDHIVFGEEVESNAASFVDAVSDESPHPGLFHEEEATVSSNPNIRTLLDNCQRVADIVSCRAGIFDPVDWRFKHGPGAVSDRRFGEYKYSFNHWPDRLEYSFPYADFAVANYAHVGEMSVAEARLRGFFSDPPARLCAVPKTIKTPRLIAAEPVSLQWCQQAVRDFFYSRVRCTFIGLFVDFHDQSVNGDLAREASHSQAQATIDLSSASDRISCWHVERLFRRSPTILRALQASRSAWVRQDICRYSPQYHYLRKYSTMGNATTFPVQSLFFLVLAIAAVLTVRGKRVNERSIVALAGSGLRVFGDDIIVPEDGFGTLVDLLQALELRVNNSKTFGVGRFRESCGVDAYDGHTVSTVSILEKPSRAAPSSIVSSVDTHNSLLTAGYFATSAFLRKTADIAGFRKIREVKHGDGAFGWWTFGVPRNKHLRARFERYSQRLQLHCLQQVAGGKRAAAEGDPGLLQFFTEAACKVTSAQSTLGYLTQRPQAKLSLRWASV